MVVNGELFRKRRDELGLTQEQLEANCGVTQGKISQIESGKSKSLTTKVMVALARGLKINPADENQRKLYFAIFLS